MSSFPLRHCEPADAAAVADLIAAHERSCRGESAFNLAELLNEWRVTDLEHTWAALEGDRVVGFGQISERGELWRADGYVHPDAFGRGLGTQLAVLLEAEARSRGAKRVQNSVLEADSAARDLMTALHYSEVRRFREMRIDLAAAPLAPVWPEGLLGTPFDPATDAQAFHAAQQEAFDDHWEFRPRTFEEWSHIHLEGPAFEPSLWSVVRDRDETVAGAICRLEAYGGGWVDVLFTRAPWRRRGVGEALLVASFAKLWERGQASVGLGVDAQSDTGAFRLYERMGMKPAWAAVTFEKVFDG
jgi:ribosomal protein S18 acetylase RimI-like enzyme